MTDISFHASYPTLLYILNPCSISYNSYSCQPTRSLLWPTRPTGTYWLGLERSTFVALNPSWIGTLYKCYVHFRIRNGLSGAALKFYEREFSFFKKVTSISGIIRWGDLTPQLHKHKVYCKCWQRQSHTTQMKLFELYMIAHDLLMCLSMYCIICETGVGMGNIIFWAHIITKPFPGVVLPVPLYIRNVC